MSIEALLTFATVLLAILALIPRERANDIRLKVSGWPAFVFGAIGLAELYWALMEQIHSLPFIRNLPRPLAWLWDWTPATISLLAVLAGGGLGWLCLRRKLAPTRLGKLRDVLSGALARRQYEEAMHLLDLHTGTIETAVRGAYWQLRLRKRLAPTLAEQHLMALRAPATTTPLHLQVASEEGQDDGHVLESSNQESSRAAVSLLRGVPREPGRLRAHFARHADGPQDAAADILRTIGLAPAFVRAIAESNPHLGIRLLRLPSSWILREFAEAFAGALFDDSDSILFRELRRAENLNSDGDFIVDRREQPLLALLLEDSLATGGSSLIWAFLTAGLARLERGPSQAVVQELNSPMLDFHNRGRWSSPEYVTIHLLHVIVPRVAVAKDAQPLNLYVLASFARAVLNVMPHVADEDATGEWPSRAHYLLYECVSALVDWVGISRTRTREFEAIMASQATRAEKITVPHHAAEVLGEVMRECLCSARLTARFRGYLMEVWWRAYADKYSKGEWPLAAATRNSLLGIGTFSSIPVELRAKLNEALEHVDHMYLSSAPGKELVRRVAALDEK